MCSCLYLVACVHWGPCSSSDWHVMGNKALFFSSVCLCRCWQLLVDCTMIRTIFMEMSLWLQMPKYTSKYQCAVLSVQKGVIKMQLGKQNRHRDIFTDYNYLALYKTEYKPLFHVFDILMVILITLNTFTFTGATFWQVYQSNFKCFALSRWNIFFRQPCAWPLVHECPRQHMPLFSSLWGEVGISTLCPARHSWTSRGSITFAEVIKTFKELSWRHKPQEIHWDIWRDVCRLLLI